MENTIKYGDYAARIVYDDDDKVFHGRVLNMNDMVTFEATTVAGIAKEFRKSVDEYLKFCKEIGKEPEKPFSGKLIVRTDPETHRGISTIAEIQGKSMNVVVQECLQEYVAGHTESRNRQTSVKMAGRHARVVPNARKKKAAAKRKAKP